MTKIVVELNIVDGKDDYVLDELARMVKSLNDFRYRGPGFVPPVLNMHVVKNHDFPEAPRWQIIDIVK